MPEVLYKSAAIKTKINELFGAPDKSDRRVALVAYIGQDYADYLPSPRGIDVVCNPTPGATSVIAVDGLRKAGALVRFSDKLHMKVYWSKARGCVITSANLSKNAFGIRGLKEAGVWLEPNSVDIDKLVKEAQPYEVTDSSIERLRVDENRYDRALAQIRPREANSGFQYLDWYRLSTAARTPWKVGDYNGDDGIADAARDRLKKEFNADDAANWHGVSKKLSLRKEDWLLQFEYDDENGKVIGKPEWMFVDFVVRFGSPGTDPFQAIQVRPTQNYERPPFRLTVGFRKALGGAVLKLKEKSVAKGSMLPSDLLLKEIADRLLKEAKSPFRD
jgi:hypothetical protein